MMHGWSPENMDWDPDDVFKHSTTLTNKQRGNEVTVRPATLDCEYSDSSIKCVNKALADFSSTVWRYLHFVHQLCPYTSWQLKASFRKWLHTSVRVRKLVIIHYLL